MASKRIGVIDSGGGRTQVTFDHVPDVPITAFDLDLPAGPHSALDAPMQDLCKGGLALAERLTGQNGAVLEGAVPVRVTDCPRIGRVRAGALTRAGRTVRVRVTAPAPGLITVGGMGLERVARRADRPGTYTVRTRLTTRAVAILARRHRLSIRANVVFRPDNAPSPSTASAGLVVRRRAGEPK